MTPLLAGLSRANLGRELLAGVTLLAIAIPLNIGYAQIAGLPPTAGLYALVLPPLIYALVVSSRQVVASPDAAAAALVASSVGGLAAAGSANYAVLAAAQAIISGILFIVLAVLRLGFLASFLSKPILVGFVAGLALDILVSQVAKMLGVPIDSGSEFLEKVAGVVTGLGSANGWSMLVAAGSLTVLLLGRRVRPRVPWALLVLVAATVVVVLTRADAAGVDVLGEVPAGPPALSWPSLTWSQWIALIPSAIALTLVTTAEGLLVARAYAERRHYPTRPNRDLLAFGVANVAAGASASFAVGSSTSRTAAMDQAGSRTQLPSIVLAAGTLTLLLFGTALLAEIPSPAIGAIVAVAVVPLLGISDLRALWRTDRCELLVAAACFAVTLLVGAIPGILVAFVLSLVNLARRAAHPTIEVLTRDDDPQQSLLTTGPTGALTAPGVLLIRLAAPMFFANAGTFTQATRDAVIAAGGPDAVHHLVLDMEAVTDVDVTAAESFSSLQEWLADQKINLAFTRLRPATRDRLDTFALVGRAHIYDTNRAAVTALETRPTTDEREERRE